MFITHIEHTNLAKLPVFFPKPEIPGMEDFWLWHHVVWYISTDVSYLHQGRWLIPLVPLKCWYILPSFTVTGVRISKLSHQEVLYSWKRYKLREWVESRDEDRNTDWTLKDRLSIRGTRPRVLNDLHHPTENCFALFLLPPVHSIVLYEFFIRSFKISSKGQNRGDLEWNYWAFVSQTEVLKHVALSKEHVYNI